MRAMSMSSSSMRSMPTRLRARCSAEPRRCASTSLFIPIANSQLAAPPILPAARERRRERLRRQIGGELGIAGAPREEPQHRVHVTAIEERERRTVVTCEEFVVGDVEAGHLFAYYERGAEL